MKKEKLTKYTVKYRLPFEKDYSEEELFPSEVQSLLNLVGRNNIMFIIQLRKKNRGERKELFL